MSIEHENFDNILQNKDEKDLEQYGVWVKKPSEEEAKKKEDGNDSSAFFIDDLDFADVPDIDTIPKAVNDNLNAKIDRALESAATAAPENSAEELTPIEEAETEVPVPAEETFEIDDFNIEEYVPHTEEKNKTVADEQPLDIDLSFDDNFEQIMPDFPKESEETAEVKSADKTDSAAGGEFEEIDASMFDSDEPLEPSVPESIDLEAAAVPVADGNVQTESVPLEAFENPDNTETVADEPPAMESVDISAFDTESAGVPSTVASNEKSQTDQIYDIAVKADDETGDSEQDEKPHEQAKTADVQTMSSSLLEKIMGELSLLRHDINELKEDFTTLKTAPAPSAGDTSKADEKEGGGFFADDGGDDTIALSGDELNNILTSADFTDEAENEKENASAAEPSAEAPAEIKEEAFPEIELPEELMIDEAEAEAENTEEASPMPELNIEENELHEPQLDDIDFDLSENETVEEELPSEIEIPVVEDLVVDSSAEDFFDEDDTPKEIDETDVRFLAENPAEAEHAAEVAEEPAAKPEADSLIEAEDEKEETDQYSPINQVFNSRQWQSEGETDLSLEEEAPAEVSEPAEEKTTETVFGKNIDTDGGSAHKTEQPANIPQNMRDEIKSVLAYMDQLLENLPEEKIVEFAQSEHFPVYKKLFNELGLS